MRVIFDASGTVLEQNDYYAFGGKHFNSALTASNNRFKYNGKELQTTGNVDFLDYGARMYDTKLVRTHTQDLLQEDYYGISSYAYCFNDPVRYVDMFGMYPDDPVSSMRQNIGTVNVNGGRGDDYNWFSAWIRQLAAVRDRDIDKAKQYGLEALRLIEGTLHGFLSRQAYEDYLKEGSTSSYLKLIGLEIFGQWTSPELLVGGVSMGIGGLQVVNSPLKAGAGGTKAVVPKATTTVQTVKPGNKGALGNWKTEYLMPGTKIDRFGRGTGNYFSPMGTPMEMRALPPGNNGVYNSYTVIKPFPVQTSTIAPAYGKIGLGTQYISPVNAETLVKHGVIKNTK